MHETDPAKVEVVREQLAAEVPGRTIAVEDHGAAGVKYFLSREGGEEQRVRVSREWLEDRENTALSAAVLFEVHRGNSLLVRHDGSIEAETYPLG